MQLLISNRIVKIIQSYLFFCFLLLLYVIEIYPRFSYVGFNLEFDILLIAISIISIFISTSLLSNSSTASSFVIHVVHYILVLPSILIFTFSAPSVLHSFLILLLVITSYTTTNRRMVIPKIKKINAGLLNKVLVILSFFMVSYMIIRSPYIFSLNFSLDSVYEYRRDYAANFDMIQVYGFSNVAYAFIPLSTLISYVKKQYIIVFLNMLFSIILFGLTQHKAVLFVPFATIILYEVYKRGSYKTKKQHTLMGWFFIALLVLCTIEIMLYKFLGINAPGSLTSYIARRGLLTPAFMDSNWLDFFSNGQFYYWATSKFSLGLTENPYDLTAPFLIGWEIFGFDNMSANTGVIGSGYAQAGIIGVVFYCVMLRYILLFLNTIGEYVGSGFIAATSSLILLNIFVSSDIFTMLLTHGLLLMIFLASILGKVR